MNSQIHHHGLLLIITFQPSPHRSPIWRMLQLHLCVPKYLTTIFCDAQPIRMFSSSVLTFLPVIVYYLPYRPTNRLLQPQSCSARRPQHSKRHPISHCCVNTQSHHIRPDSRHRWCVHKYSLSSSCSSSTLSALSNFLIHTLACDGNTSNFSSTSHPDDKCTPYSRCGTPASLSMHTPQSILTCSYIIFSQPPLAPHALMTTTHAIKDILHS